MAITRVRRLFPGRSGRRDFQGRVTYTLIWEVVTDDANHAEEEVYGAVDPDNPAEKVPEFGDTHPQNEGAPVVGVDIEQLEDSPFLWHVTVEYDTQPESPGAGQPTATGSLDGVAERGNSAKDYPRNPLLRNPVWKTGHIDREEPIEEWLRISPTGQFIFKVPPAWAATTTYRFGQYVANNGRVYYAVNAEPGISGVAGPAGLGDEWGEQTDGTVVWAHWSTLNEATTDPRHAIYEACTNSAGLPFDPPKMTPVAIPTLIVTKNLPVMDIIYVTGLKNAVNLYKWGPIPPFCAKVLKFDSGFKDAEHGFPEYVEATWEIGLDPDTWAEKILDAGLGSYPLVSVPDPANPTGPRITKKVFRNFEDPSGAPVSQPVPMDGNGGKLGAEESPVYLRGFPKQVRLIDFNEFIPFRLPGG